jgi:hypothetical protein
MPLAFAGKAAYWGCKQETCLSVIEIHFPRGEWFICFAQTALQKNIKLQRRKL